MGGSRRSFSRAELKVNRENGFVPPVFYKTERRKVPQVHEVLCREPGSGWHRKSANLISSEIYSYGSSARVARPRLSSKERTRHWGTGLHHRSELQRLMNEWEELGLLLEV